MYFGKFHLYINADISFQGVLSIMSVRNFDEFQLQLQLHKLKTQDKNVINTVWNVCNDTPFRIEILDKVDTEIISNCHLNYNEIGKYIIELNNTLQSIYGHNVDPDPKYNFSIGGKVNVVLTTSQAYKLYTVLKSFYENYFVMETMFKMTIKNPPIENKQQSQNKQVQTQQLEKNIQDVQINTEQLETIDNIFYLCCNSVVKSSLIHMFYTYYKYINSSHVSIDKDENNNIITKIPCILPAKCLFSTSYVKSIITSLMSVSFQNIKMYLTKVMNTLINDQKVQSNPIYIMMCSYLLFIYFLRFVYEQYSNYFNAKYEQVFINSAVQESMMNKYIEGYFSEYNKFKFSIYDFKIENFKDGEKDTELIKTISEQYKYLINVSEDEFLKNVFNDIYLNKQQIQNSVIPDDFKLSNQKILDVNVILNGKSMKESKPFIYNVSGLFDHYNSLEPVLNEQTINTNLLDYYVKDDVFYSPCYELYVRFLNDPSVLLIEGKTIPLTVKKNFEVFKTLLSKNTIPENEIRTLKFYEITCNVLPASSILSHITILYVIFQLIIPYSCNYFKNRQFIDHLL